MFVSMEKMCVDNGILLIDLVRVVTYQLMDSVSILSENGECYVSIMRSGLCTVFRPSEFTMSCKSSGFQAPYWRAPCWLIQACVRMLSGLG